MKENKLSIKDIARLAGVSVATVSRVINQNGRFSKETERKVLDIIEQYNYRPNELARGLRVHKAQVIGVICLLYTSLFDEALERYNAKQKRSDRKIDSYYEKIRQSKQEKLFHKRRKRRRLCYFRRK